MRRLVPWALLGLLVVGATVGAVLGQAAAPSASTVAAAPARTPAQWVRALLAATARAGSARFSYMHVTDSPNPVLRNTVAGSGAVDFTTGAVQVAEVERQRVSSTAGLLLPHTTPAQNTVAPARPRRGATNKRGGDDRDRPGGVPGSGRSLDEAPAAP